jgi:hypothetical protein
MDMHLYSASMNQISDMFAQHTNILSLFPDHISCKLIGQAPFVTYRPREPQASRSRQY